MRRTKTLIVIPTYNERENLPILLAQLCEVIPHADVLIVDDNSPDGTGKLACEFAHNHPQIYVLHREKKEGLGRAYIAGFAWALAWQEHRYDYIIQMDADLSHDPKDIPRLIATLESQNADLIIGSRYVKGGDIAHWEIWRQCLSRLGNVFAKYLLRMPIQDMTSGFKCWRFKALKHLDLSTISSNGYVFQVEMSYQSYRRKLKITEIPIIFTNRHLGQSKMHKNIILEAIILILNLRLKTHLPDSHTQKESVVLL
jgi:dolichol-phosphate mannosyltransferase